MVDDKTIFNVNMIIAIVGTFIESLQMHHFCDVINNKQNLYVAHKEGLYMK